MNGSQWEKALKTKGTRIRTFPNFPELVHLYQSENYRLSRQEIFDLTRTNTMTSLLIKQN